MIRNIGPQTTKRLESIGIKTLEDIETLGVVEVYERLKLAYPEKVSLNALWALQGAILDIPWNEISKSIKENLKQQLGKGE
jgi:DNA transformation protein and related proteins